MKALIEIVLMWRLHDRMGDLGLRRYGVFSFDCTIGYMWTPRKFLGWVVTIIRRVV